jgi:hypothetical protein
MVLTLIRDTIPCPSHHDCTARSDSHERGPGRGNDSGTGYKLRREQENHLAVRGKMKRYASAERLE